MKSLVIFLILFVCLFGIITSETVTKTGDCQWTTSETGITLDLSGISSLETNDPLTGYKYKYFPCTIKESWDDYVCSVESKAALCQRSSGGENVLVATNENVEVEVLTSSDTSASFDVTYSGGDPGRSGIARSGIVTITCYQLKDNLIFDVEYHPVYYFSFSVATACKKSIPSTGNAPALFLILLIVSLLGVITYIVAGVLLMYFYKKVRGVALIPNLEFWKDFPFLLKDGFLFTFSCYPPFREWIGNKPGIGKGGNSYEPVM